MRLGRVCWCDLWRVMGGRLGGDGWGDLVTAKQVQSAWCHP